MLKWMFLFLPLYATPYFEESSQLLKVISSSIPSQHPFSQNLVLICTYRYPKSYEIIPDKLISKGFSLEKMELSTPQVIGEEKEQTLSLELKPLLLGKQPLTLPLIHLTDSSHR